MRAVLIATGYQPELEPLMHHRPSPLIKVVDKYIIVHVIEYLVKQGIHKFDIVLNHLPQQIERVLEEGKRWGAAITYHLAKDPAFPFASIKPIAHFWGAENIILGQADCLPKFSKHPFREDEKKSSILFFYPSKEWTGWGVVPATLLSKLPIDTSIKDFISKAELSCKTLKAVPFLSTQNVHEIIQSNIRFITQTSHTGIYPAGAHMADLGVWISHAVVIHPGIIIHPPIFIGENCQIQEKVQLGPNVIIENNCIIDKGSTIEHSLICQKSYVGEGLNIAHSLVDRNLLINLSHQSILYIRDDFILSGLTPPHWLESPLKWFEQLFALVFMILLFPFFGMMMFSCTLKKTAMLQLPAERDPTQWKTFNWLHFVPRNGSPPNPFQQTFLRLPVLLNIIRGQVHFVGVTPRSIEETAKLPLDWQKLYLKCNIGLISLDRLDFGPTVNSDDTYAAEAYYAVHQGIRFDLGLMIRWLKQKILFFRGKGKT
jgi:hypothetical protein